MDNELYQIYSVLFDMNETLRDIADVSRGNIDYKNEPQMEEHEYVECPNCGRHWEKDKNETYRFNYCPCCGIEWESSTLITTM